MELPAATKPTNANFVRVIRKNVQWIKVVTNHSIGTCSSELYSFNLLKLPPPPRAAICYTTYIGNWVIICNLPPIQGTRKLHWTYPPKNTTPLWKVAWFLWYWETPESERGVTIGASAVFPNKRDEVGVNVSLSPKKMGCETWSAICINFNNIRQNNTLEVSEKKCLNNTWHYHLHYLKGLGALFISTIHWHKHQVLHLFGTWNS